MSQPPYLYYSRLFTAFAIGRDSLSARDTRIWTCCSCDSRPSRSRASIAANAARIRGWARRFALSEIQPTRSRHFFTLKYQIVETISHFTKRNSFKKINNIFQFCGRAWKTTIVSKTPLFTSIDSWTVLHIRRSGQGVSRAAASGRH